MSIFNDYVTFVLLAVVLLFDTSIFYTTVGSRSPLFYFSTCDKGGVQYEVYEFPSP